MREQHPLHKAMELMSRGKTGPARALCRKVLHQSPNHFDAHHLYGVLCLRDGDYAKATEAFHQALQCKAPIPQQAQANSNLSLSLLQQGNLAEALDAANQALELGGDQVPFLGNRANIHEVMEDWPAMEQDLRGALNLDPDNHEFILGLAIACRNQQRLEEALTLLHPLLSSTPTDRALLWEWLLVRSLMEGPEKAALEVPRLCSEQSTPLYEEAGDYCCENGHNGLALPFYRRAKALAPDDEALEHRLAALEGRTAASAPDTYVTRLYDSHAPAFEQRLVGRLGYRAPWLLPERLAFLRRKSFSQVLDLGCGTGLAGPQLCAQLQVGRLEGVDLSREMLKKANGKGCYDQLHATGMLAFLAESEAQYDLICALDVLIYLGSLEGLFAAVKRSLAPRGLFAFTVELAKEGDFHLQPSGRYQHGRAYLERLAREQGFTPLDIEAIPLRLEKGQPIDGLMVVLESP